MATLLKTLTLELNTQSVECQLSKAELVDEPTTEDVETFCGTETFATPNYKLNLGGFQDWGDVTGVCDLLWDATDAAQNVDFILTVGPTDFTGEVAPKRTVAGGDAGAAFTYEVTLAVQGTVAKAPHAAADEAQADEDELADVEA